VGSQLPFDRLVRALDDLLVGNEVFAQIGHSFYKPRHMRWVTTVEKGHFNKLMNECSAVISHAGIGTILEALTRQKPLLVIPRLKRYKEAVNDHQIITARKFEQLGQLLVAYKTENIPEKIEQLKNFIPNKRECQKQAIIDYISRFIKDLDDGRKRNEFKK